MRAPLRLSRRETAVLALGVVAPMALFAVLAIFVAPGSPPGWDRTGFANLYSGESDWPLGPTPGQDNPVLQVVMPQLFRLTDDRELALLGVLILAGLLIARRLRAAVFFSASVVIGAASPLFKSAFERPAPFPLPGDHSFPSGHGIVSMTIAAAGVVLVAGTRWFIPAILAGVVIILAIGTPVIADGGHWPSDVIAGWCIGIAWVSVLFLAIGGRGRDLTSRAGGSARTRSLDRRSQKAIRMGCPQR